MANNIKIGFQFTPANQLKSELNTLLNNISKNTKLDFKINFNDINKQLDTIRSKLQNGLNLDGITKSAYSSAKLFENELNSLGETIGKLHQKSDFKLNTKNGLQEAKEVNRALEEQYKLEQQISAIRSKADSNNRIRNRKEEEAQAKAINKALEEQYSLEQKINSTKSTLQSKLNTLNGNGFINPSVLQSIQTELNGITSKTPQAIDKLNGLKQTISNLGSLENPIVRVQNKITQMTSALNNLKSKGLINTSNTAQVQAYEQQLERLKNILVQLQNGKTIGGATIRNELESMTNASRNLNASLQTTTSSIGGFGRSLQSGLASMGIYVSTAMLVRKALNEIKEGFNEVVQVEDSLTSLKRIYTMTNEEAQNLTQTISNQALAMGTQTSVLLDLTTTWKKLGYSIDEAQNLAKQTQMFDYSADIKNTELTATSLVSIMKGFGIVADDVNKVADAVDAVGNNFATNATDINEAMRLSSSALGAFGNDLNQSIAMATKMQEVLQNSSTVGNSLKSIASRLTSNKNAIEAIEGVGISLDDANGKLKSTYQLIKELGAVYENLPKNADTAKWLSDLFGIRQVSAGVTLLNTYKELDGVIQTIGNNEGIVAKEFEMRMNTTSAKIEQLKQTVNQAWEKTFNSDFTKGFIEGLTNLIKTFGNVPSVIGIATSAMLLFNQRGIISAINGIGRLGSSLMNATSTFGSFTGAVSMSMSTLQMSLGVIGLAIAGLTMYYDYASQYNDRLIESNNKYVESVNSIKNPSDTQGMLNNYKALEEKLSTLSEGTQEYAETERELENVQNSLIGIYPQTSTVIEENTGKKRLNLEATQNLIDADKRLAEADANKMLNKNDISDIEDVKKLAEEYKKASKYLDELNARKAKGETSFVNEAGVTVDVDKALKYASKDYEVLASKVNVTRSAISVLGNENGRLAGGLGILDNALKDLSKSTEITKSQADLLKEALSNITVGKDIDTNTIDKLNEMFPNLELTSGNAKEKVDELKRLLSGLGEGASIEEVNEQLRQMGIEAEGANDEVKSLQDQFSGFSNTKGILQDVIDEMEKYGGITEKTYAKVLGNQEVINALKKPGDQISNLNEAIRQCDDSMQKVVDTAFGTADAVTEATKQETDAKLESDSQKQDSDSETNAQIQQNASDTTNSNSNEYNTDCSNFETIANNKAMANDAILNAIANGTSLTMNSLGGMYSEDVVNFINAVNEKIKAMNAFSQAMARASLAGASVIGGAVGNAGAEVLANAGINTSMPDIPIVSEVGSNYAPKSVGNPSSGSKGSGGKKSGKSDAEKAQEEAEKWREKIAELNSEIDTDRYFDLNNALADINNALTNNKTIQEQLYGSALINAQKQEIELMKQKQEAINNINKEQIKEADELKNYLTQYGFYFDENNKLINSQQRLLEIQESVNAMAGETEEEYNNKKEWVDWLKEIQEKTESYADLIEDKIPKCTNDFKELGNSIRQLQLDTLESLREELASNILEDMKEELKASQEALEEAEENDIEALEKEKQAMIDSYDAQIKSLREELDALNDDSKDKKAKLKALKNELKLWEKDDSVNIFCIKYIDINAPYVQKCA